MDREIREYTIFGERCTGTNYIDQLIKLNFALKNTQKFGHKHMKIGHDFDDVKNSVIPTKENSKNCLFLIVVRNPYDWSQSFNISPWHAKKHLLYLPYSEFIRSKWESIDNMGKIIPSDLKDDGTFFNDIFELRASKIREHLKLFNIVKNCVLVNYENVENNYQEFLDMLHVNYNLKKISPEYQNVTFYKDVKSKSFVKKDYGLICADDLLYINNMIDWKLESLIGYYPKDEII